MHRFLMALGFVALLAFAPVIAQTPPVPLPPVRTEASEKTLPATQGEHTPTASPGSTAVVSDPATAPPCLTCPPTTPEPTLVERLGTYYDRGFVLMESSDPDRIPFKLVVGNFAQMRYTNTQLD